jgi:hypothetical protein
MRCIWAARAGFSSPGLQIGPDPSLRFPPYTPRKVALLSRLRTLSLRRIATVLGVTVLLPVAAAYLSKL